MYADTDDWSSLASMLSYINNRLELVYTEQVQIHGHRLIDPTDGSVVHTQTFLVGQPCDRDPVENFTIYAVGRWRFTAEDGSQGYHLHRYPADVSWIEGDKWSSSGLAEMLSGPGTVYAGGFIRSATGSPIETWELSGDVSEWQLRHGTKRRNSRFWLP